MKRGIPDLTIDTQLQFIQLCTDLFSNEEEIANGSADKLVQFLKEAPLQKLDFNVQMEESPFGGNSPLGFMIDAAFNGKPYPFNIVLDQVPISKLDFNLKGKNGTLLRRIALATAKNSTEAPDVLQLILDSVDLTKLDFNAQANEAQNTVLHLIMVMAEQENIRPLQTILNKADLSLLDFNAKSNEGETPLWWLAFFLAMRNKNLHLLEKVLAKGDISRLDFNAKMNNSSFSVLSLLAIAAAQGEVGPLTKIVEEPSVLLHIDVSNQMGKDILFNLVLTTMIGHPEPLKRFLSNEKIAACWGFDEKVKETLFQASQENLVEMLIETLINKRSVLEVNKLLPAAIARGNINLALACIQAGANKSELRYALLEAIKNGHDEVVRKIFVYYEAYGFPIKDLFNQENFTLEEINSILINPFRRPYNDAILSNLQLNLIQYCMDLFSPDGEINESIFNDFARFLQEIPLHRLDLNFKMTEGPLRENTLLWAIALAAYKGRHFLFIIALNKLAATEQISKLDFNANPPDGKNKGRTVLWLFVKAALIESDPLSSSVLFDVLKKIINKADMSKVDFNAKAEWGAAKNQTVLSMLMRTSGELILLVLNALLEKGRISHLDFNATFGATTPLWWLASLAADHMDPAPLQLVLDHCDMWTLNLNAKCMSTTVLHLIVEAAAGGMVKPLKTILNKATISDLNFNSESKSRRSMLFFLTLAAIAGHPELLRTILLNKQIDPRRIGEDAEKILSQDSQEKISLFLINKIINQKKELKKNLSSCIRFGYTDVALALIEAGADTNELLSALKEADQRGHAHTVQKLFPHSKLYGVPILEILDDKTFFNTFNKISEFLRSESQLSYLKSLCSEQTYCALVLLNLANEVKNYYASLLIGEETVMAESKIARANWYFEHVIEPVFKGALSFYGNTQASAIEAIHREIRELILNTIIEQAKERAINEGVIEFVTQNREALLNLEDKAMKESCNFFTSNDTAQSAWRGYNPYAPVRSAWPNLLTPPPITDEKEVYNMIRRRIAFYFLAVKDENDGGVDIRKTREKNFISQLDTIRNGHGKDDPSCLEGTLTRIADMGAFHSIAQLPPTAKEWLLDYFKGEILPAFEVKLNMLSTLEEKEALLKSLTELTRHTAKDVIKDPKRYNERWLRLRNDFIRDLGTPTENLESIFQQDLFPIVQDDLIYIAQILTDIAGDNKMHAALVDCFNRHIDRSPTEEELSRVNPFKVETNAHELHQLLLDVIFKLEPQFLKSARKLESLTTLLEQKVPRILKNGEFEEALEGLEFDDRSKVYNEIKVVLKTKDWWNNQGLINNPFDSMVLTIEMKLKNFTNTTHPQIMDKLLEQLLKQSMSLRNKQTLFNQYYLRVQDVFKGSAATAEFMSHFTESVVMFIEFHKKWDVDKFQNEFEKNNLALDVKDRLFLQANLKCLLRFQILENENLIVNTTYTPGFDAKMSEKPEIPLPHANHIDPTVRNVVPH